MRAEQTMPAPLPLLLSGEHRCSYLAGRRARSLLLDPREPRAALAYPRLAALGFRRSGRLIYRPHCEGCAECRAVRVPVARFRARRSQRRCLRGNRDLVVGERPLEFDPAHFSLYRRYLAARHPGAGMDDPSVRDYTEFLLAPWPGARLLEFRLAGEPVAVAVVDRVADGLSAVYTFYEPRLARRGLGIYAVLEQIARARREGLAYLYLGYWIEGSAKMRYKRTFRPLEVLRGGRWMEFG